MTSLKSKYLEASHACIKLAAIFLINISGTFAGYAFGSPLLMQAPPKKTNIVSASVEEAETSVTRLVFIGAIDFYRQIISPTSGARCGFTPTCSAFGRQAVSQYGPVKGVMMTADRLTRCNVFKKPDQDYYLLPDGSLFDPVFYNSLNEQ